ncbi:tetratricopeptide repeat protein [Psychrobacter sp. DAB_AL43B]|uniref:tetratricopeptide repeat protein n=1 Tax=Psychrobacter sp. DAB_AL43B TaxID=1028416 RepID=UPI0009A606B9|nr:hypothetical protein [Psychrobacter sp. DAB_AL43B]SLJ84288.1 hypothetical protein DABAL43B_1090 [Psychrobacter sp. DAB_AL43B]
MHLSHTNNGEQRLTMTSINSSIKVSFKLPKALLVGLFIMGSAMSAAHSELVIQEKDPGASIINQFAALKSADAQSVQLHQLITDLNQRLDSNPNDSLAWEILAQIYYNNGYHDYAVYAASEAIDLGQNTAKLKKILLNSSAIVSQSQLQSDYLTDEVDGEFLKQYQYALSKIYGEIYGFNYDESLPKPPAPVVKSRNNKTTSKSKAQRRASVKKQATPAKKATPPKRKAAVKQPPRPVPKAKPVNKPAKPPSSRNSNAKSTDPFSILR